MLEIHIVKLKYVGNNEAVQLIAILVEIQLRIILSRFNQQKVYKYNSVLQEDPSIKISRRINLAKREIKHFAYRRHK